MRGHTSYARVRRAQVVQYPRPLEDINRIGCGDAAVEGYADHAAKVGLSLVVSNMSQHMSGRRGGVAVRTIALAKPMYLA